MCPEKKALFQSVSLSRNTVAERINEISADLDQKLCKAAKNFFCYSLAMDDSTDTRDIAQLAIFVRGCDTNFDVTEELLELFPLVGTTTCADLFSALETSMDRSGLLWSKLSGLTTDGAPCMVGENMGLVGHIKRRLECETSTIAFSSYHCIIHQENLCAKLLKMDHVMSTVIHTVNFIRSRGLNHRQFASFLEELNSEYGELLYNSAVRWLSRGHLLKRFYVLRSEIASFMELKGKPIPELSSETWILDLAFLVDITEHLNLLNVKLQGRNQLITDVYGNVKAFEMKLSLWSDQLKQGIVTHFPTLATLLSGEVSHYSCLLDSLRTEFERRFQDFRSCETDLQLFSNPFQVLIETAPSLYQMELIDLQCSITHKEKFAASNLLDFYRSLPDTEFPKLRANACRMASMFGNTYLCEQLFSQMKLTKSTIRTRLSQVRTQSLRMIGHL